MSKKKDKGAPEVPSGTVTVSIAAHPRARAGIRRARTRAALIAFVLVLVLNVLGEQSLFDATWRALIAGIVVNVIAWRCAIVVWRHIILAEIRTLEADRAERRRAEQERANARAAEQAKSPGFNAA